VSLAVCPASVNFGETNQCTISAAGETDTYTINGTTSGDRIRVRIIKTSGTLAPYHDVLQNGTTLCARTTAQERTCLLGSGTHTITVRDLNGTNTGGYSIYIQRLNNPVGCTSLTFGSAPLASSISVAAETDCFTFSGTANDRVRFKQLKTAGTLIPYVEVLRADGTTQCGPTTAPEFTCLLDTTGTYTILVRDVSGPNTGSYLISLQRLNNLVGCNPPLTFGAAPVSDSIALAAKMNCFTFDATANDRVRFKQLKTAGTLIPYVEVLRADGTTQCGPTTAPEFTCLLDTTGTYTILVRDVSGPNTGSYLISLQRLNNPVGCPPIVPFGSAPLTGSIAVAAEADCIPFDGAAGDRIRVRVVKTAGTLILYVEVLRPDGTTLCGPTTTQELTCLLDTSGTYTILVRDVSGPNTGSYLISIQRLNNPVGCNAPPFGTTTPGSIAVAAETDCFTFIGTVGGQVRVKVIKTAGPLILYVEVLRPDGTTLCGPTTAPEFTCQLDTTGTYTILVRDLSGRNTGNYTLTLTAVVPPPPSVPVLASPPNGSLTTDYTPLFNWNNSTVPAGITFDYYQVQVATDAAFTAIVIDTNVPGLANSEFTPVTDLAPNTRHYWHVRSCNTTGQCSNWSAVWSFRTALTPPTNLTVTDGDKTLRPKFDWDDVALPGVTGYTIQVSTSPTFATLNVNATVVASTFTPAADLPRDKTLYWRVRTNGANGPSAWADGPAFTSANPPGVPVLVSPLNNALTTDYTPLLNWNNSIVPVGTTFDHYQLQVATDAIFTGIVIDTNIPGLANSEFTPPTDLAPNTRYYWHVRAFNTDTEYSLWSATWNFRTALTPPTNLIVIDGDKSLRPKFDWGDVALTDVTGYTIQASISPVFATVVVSANVVASQFTPAADLPRDKTIYWRVRTNGANGPSAWADGPAFTSANPPGVPVLVSPINGSLTTDYTPLFNWNNSIVPAGITFDHYQLQVATDAAFTSIVIDQNIPGLANSEFTPPTDLAPNTRYYWHVRAFNTDTEYSLWSATWNFRTALTPPINLIVIDGDKTLRPKFDWDDVALPGVTGYTIQASISPVFATVVVSANVVASQFTPAADLPRDKTIYWRVRTNGANGPSAWADGPAFTSANPPSVPVLVSPLNGSLTTDYTPRLDWNNSTVPAGITFDHYQLQVATVAGIVIDTNIPGLANSEFTPPTDLAPNTRYYWHVRAFNSDTEYSLWSATWNFRTALTPPTLISPTDGETLLTTRPTFDWDVVDGATSYTLQVSTTPAFTTLNVNVAVTASAYTIPVDLPKNKVMYWRVRSNGANGPSAWSGVRSFTSANPPSVPVLLSPANGATVTSTPTLTWSASTVPVGTTLDHYQVQIATSNTFSAIEQQSNTGTINSYTATALGSGIHYWRVRAFNIVGQYSNWSVVRSFRVAAGSILFQFNGAAIGDKFGYSAAGGQDINGDNHPDFIVGAIETDPNGLTNAGSAFVYSGLDGALLRRFDGASADMSFGLEVAEVGDVNNDGKADILVGTPKAAPGGVTWAGSAYVYSGATGALLFQFDGSATYGYMGEAAAGAGDINHDNHADIIVSARGSGKVFVFSGSDGTILHQFSGPFNFGMSVAGVGDVNADGVPDIGIGSPTSTVSGLAEAGSAFVYSGATGALLRQFDGANAGDWVGVSIAGAGDLNNDGRSDLIVAAMCNRSNHAGCTPSGARGYVSVFSGATGSLLFHFEGEGANDAFGRSVAGPGDMNGDGVPDIVVGAFHADTGSILDTGRIYVYSGANGAELYRLNGFGWYDYLGNSVSGADDVNGDGNADVIVAAFYADPFGRNGAGSAYVLSLSSFAASTSDFPNNFSPP